MASVLPTETAPKGEERRGSYLASGNYSVPPPHAPAQTHPLP